MMIHKILEDNKAKLHNLCSTHISNLNTVASIPGMLNHVVSLYFCALHYTRQIIPLFCTGIL